MTPEEQAQQTIIDDTFAVPERDPYIGTKFDHAKMTAIPAAQKKYENITKDLAFGYTNAFLDMKLQLDSEIISLLSPFVEDFPISMEVCERESVSALWLSKSRGGFESKIQRTGIFKQDVNSEINDNQSKRRGFLFARKQRNEEGMM